MTDCSDPLTLFRGALVAVAVEDWRTAAETCDPVSLRSFRRQILEQLEPREPPRQITVEEFLRHTPDMPREVAEYHVAQVRRHMDPTARLQQELPSVASIDVLRGLDPVEVFARWLEGRSFRHQVARLAAEGRIPPAAAAHVGASAASVYRYVPLGVVQDGEHLAHVLYRREVDPSAFSAGEAARWLAALPQEEQALALETEHRVYPHVMTCRRQPDGTWRFLADHSFLQVASHHFDVSVSPEAEGAPGGSRRCG